MKSLLSDYMEAIMDTIILGRNIHRARRDKGLSSDKLSELCEITPAYLRQIEAGSKTPSLPLFVTLCDRLEVSPALLLAGVVESTADGSPEELAQLCKTTSPSQLKLVTALLKAALENCE